VRFLTAFPFRFLNIPEAGKWTFELESDDGSRLLIDDVEVHLSVVFLSSCFSQQLFFSALVFSQQLFFLSSCFSVLKRVFLRLLIMMAYMAWRRNPASKSWLSDSM
jgi:hypothetical protein